MALYSIRSEHRFCEPPIRPALQFLLRDRDSKFCAAFDEVFRSKGVGVIPLPFRAPRANAFAERWVGTVRRELLDHVLVFGADHLESVLREFLRQYHPARPYQGLRHMPPDQPTVLPFLPVRLNQFVRRDRVGGLIHEYERAA